MEKELIDLIRRFEAGQSYLESYRIIRDAVFLIKKIKDLDSHF